MRTIDAVLPKKMPTVFTGLGLRDQSYQDLSSTEEHSISNVTVNVPSHSSPHKFRGFILTAVVGVITLSSLLLLTTNRGPTMKSVNDAVWMEGSKIGTAYCKTSCTSQCASYFSVYGPLCCDWAEGEISSSTSQIRGVTSRRMFLVTSYDTTWISNLICHQVANDSYFHSPFERGWWIKVLRSEHQ